MSRSFLGFLKDFRRRRLAGVYDFRQIVPRYEFIQEYQAETTFINTFCYGIWYAEDWAYWADMFYNGYTPQTAFAKYESEFQYLIDNMFVE